MNETTTAHSNPSQVVKIVYCGEEPMRVVCLIGSLRYKNEFLSAAKAFALQGQVVLTPNVYTEGATVDKEEQEILHETALQRIQMSDWVFVVNPNNRMTETVYKEIEFAESLGRQIKYLETPSSK